MEPGVLVPERLFPPGFPVALVLASRVLRRPHGYAGLLRPSARFASAVELLDDFCVAIVSGNQDGCGAHGPLGLVDVCPATGEPYVLEARSKDVVLVPLSERLEEATAEEVVESEAGRVYRNQPVALNQ